MASEPKESEEVAHISDACFTYLIADPEELARFMDFAGLSPQALRTAAGGSTLTVGLMDYFAQNESALLAMCANSGITAERFMRVWHRLNPEY